MENQNNLFIYEIPSIIGKEYDDIFTIKMLKNEVSNKIKNIDEIYTIGIIGYNIFSYYSNNKVNINFKLGISDNNIKILKNKDILIQSIINLEYNRDLELKYNSRDNNIILMYWFR